MKLVARMKNCLVVGAVVGLLVPQAALAQQPTQGSIRDAALGSGGVLKGTLFSTEGQPEAGQDVHLVASGELIARVRTDADGQFEFRGLRGGMYMLQAQGATASYRLWSEDAAPPSAVSEVLLMSDDSLVARGQIFPEVSRPLLLGGLLIAAGVIGGVIGYNIKDDAS